VLPSRVRLPAERARTQEVINFTSLSEKALLWYEDDFSHKILSMGEAHGSEEWHLQDMLLRELISEGRIVYLAAQKVNGTITAIPIEKHGPVCFVVTTTRASLNPENETRLLSLEVDDSEEQTQRVLKKQAQTLGQRWITACAFMQVMICGKSRRRRVALGGISLDSASANGTTTSLGAFKRSSV
jgi:hypothetical protein